MKYAALLPLSAALVWPADINFTTGQAARLVIGQPTFTAAQPGTSQDLLGGPHGVAYANDTLFVVDANKLGASPSNHRVLIYRNLSQVLPSPTAEIEQDGRICKVCFGRADTVVGQVRV